MDDDAFFLAEAARRRKNQECFVEKAVSRGKPAPLAAVSKLDENARKESDPGEEDEDAEEEEEGQDFARHALPNIVDGKTNMDAPIENDDTRSTADSDSDGGGDDDVGDFPGDRKDNIVGSMADKENYSNDDDKDEDNDDKDEDNDGQDDSNEDDDKADLGMDEDEENRRNDANVSGVVGKSKRIAFSSDDEGGEDLRAAKKAKDELDV